MMHAARVVQCPRAKCSAEMRGMSTPGEQINNTTASAVGVGSN